MPPSREDLWRQYKIHVDLYKHYLDLALKFNAFYYAATGAFLSFYLTRPTIGKLKYSLFFMIALSAGIVALFVYGACRNRASRTEIVDITQALRLRVFPELHVLTFLLVLSATLICLVGLGFVALFFVGDQIR